MDYPQSNPAHQSQIGEPDNSGHNPEPQLNQTPDSSIESIFPTANANDLLKLIHQGDDPSDLNQLINHSKQLNDAA